MTGLILYSGSLAQVPRQGGLTWLHLQFLLGLRRLGWDVLFLDRLEPEMCVDASRGWQPTDTSPKRKRVNSIVTSRQRGDDERQHRTFE